MNKLLLKLNLKLLSNKTVTQKVALVFQFLNV